MCACKVNNLLPRRGAAGHSINLFMSEKSPSKRSSGPMIVSKNNFEINHRFQEIFREEFWVSC